MSTGSASFEVRNIHVRVRIKGSKEATERFHRLVGLLDCSWPFRPGTYPREACLQCGGKGWWTPMLNATDLKALGRQMGLRKVVVEHWAPEKVCSRKGKCFSWQR
jgi:hypothetical protein